MIVHNKVLVCYLFTKFDRNDDLSKFIDNYKFFSSGFNHKLIICLKLLDNDRVNYVNDYLINRKIKFELFNDTSQNNDYDFGSYSRVAENVQI